MFSFVAVVVVVVVVVAAAAVVVVFTKSFHALLVVFINLCYGNITIQLKIVH